MQVREGGELHSWRILFETVAPPCHVSTLYYDKCDILFLLMLYIGVLKNYLPYAAVAS